MKFTQYLLPSLSVRALGIIERLTIASLAFLQTAFLIIRQPSLFDRPPLDAAIRLFSLFLVSPIAITTFVVLVVGCLVTGVVQTGYQLPARWNAAQTGRATGIAVAGGLLSVALFAAGLVLWRPLGYGFIIAGFVLGPWLPAQFGRHAHEFTAAGSNVSRWPQRNGIWRSVPTLIVLLVIWMTDAVMLLSVEDNRRFLTKARGLSTDIIHSEPRDDDLKVARLSRGLIRYRDMNSGGRTIVLGFPGWQESIYEFPVALRAKLQAMDVRGIIVERPGIGPVSTPRPGFDLSDWVDMVAEFDKTVLDGRPVSIVGHSAGGVYALACAKLNFVKALGIVASPEPMTYGSFLGTFSNFNGLPATTVIAMQLFPNALLPEVQRSSQMLLHDWQSFKRGMIKDLGSTDGAMINANDEEFRRNMVTSVLQGAAASADDVRGMFSQWPVTKGETDRLPIVIFRGSDEQLIPLATTEDLQKRFAPNAMRIELANMGHQPALSHYEQIFETVERLHAHEVAKGVSSDRAR